MNNTHFSIGLDFGTTYSVISVKKNEKQIDIISDNGKYKIPTIIAIHKDNHGILFGVDAINKINDKNFAIIKSIKSALSSNLNDFHLIRCVSQVIDKEIACIDVGSKKYTIDELVVLFFLHLKSILDLQFKSYNCVMTIPAYMSVKQKCRIKNLAKQSGLDVIRIINEPTSAILNFHNNQIHQEEKNYIVYDLGGGTLDITGISFNNELFNVISINGDNKLGGDDFDERIKKLLFSKYPSLHIDKLSELIIYIKENSSSDIDINFENTLVQINKKELFDSCEDLIKITLNILSKTIKEISPNSIDGIVLTGGMSKAGVIRDAVLKIFPKYKMLYSHEPDFDVSKGAAILCYDINNKKFENIILDVVPLSIGIELASGTVERIVERNTPIPIEKKMSFTTSLLDQNAISFNIVQGEREFAKDCEQLYFFSIKNLPTGCLAKVEMTFRIDKDGIISIFCTEETTKQSFSHEINFIKNINNDQISSAVQESLMYAKQDMQNKIHADSINRAKVLIKNIESILKKQKDIFDEKLIIKVENEIKIVKKHIKENRTDIQSRISSLLELNDTIASEVITESIKTKIMKQNISNINNK